jgi:hypothetical protein
MFIRRKISKTKHSERPHYYLVENGRDENGKVRQKVLMYLGEATSIEQAIEQRHKWVARYREWIIEVRGWQANSSYCQHWVYQWQMGPRFKDGYHDNARNEQQKRFGTLERFAQWKLAQRKRELLAKYKVRVRQCEREARQLEKLLAKSRENPVANEHAPE